MTIPGTHLKAVHRFGALLCAAAVMEYVPAASVRTGCFVAVLLWFCCCSLLDPKLRFRVDGTGLFLFGFVGFAVSSLAWGAAQGISALEWSRGVTPFLFLLTWFGVRVESLDERYQLMHWLGIASLTWALRIVLEAGYLLLSGDIMLAMRLTGVLFDSVIPFGLMAVGIFAFGLHRHGLPYRLGALALLAMLIMWAGYRSMTLIAVAALVFLALILNRKALLALCLGAAAVAGGLILQGGGIENSVFGLFWNRLLMTSATSEMSRFSEWSYAFDSFLQSPVIGNGIGWQVPYWVTIAGASPEDIIAGIVVPESAGYVHNVTAYMLMDLGVLGLALYAAMFLCAVLPTRAALRDRVYVAALVSAGSLLVFCQVQACFRMIQVNLMFVALLRLLSSARPLLPYPLPAGGAPAAADSRVLSQQEEGWSTT